MSSPPAWALSLVYWLHMLATVVWIGGLAALSILVLPSAQRVLEPGAYSRLLDGVQRRLDPVGWLCLAVLVGTGLFQMSANPNYQGLLALNNRWAIAIFIKHLVFLAMTATSAALSWWVLPQLRRAALRQARQLDTDGQRLQSRQALLLRWRHTFLVRLNLLLAVVVLALTALARVS